MLWDNLARVTSLTHLSLPDRTPLSFSFSTFKNYNIHIHVAFSPHFANQPMKEMKINTGKNLGKDMVDVVRRHWQGIVFPHVEYLETDRCSEIIPIEFWKEFLTNVKKCKCIDHIVSFVS